MWVSKHTFGIVGGKKTGACFIFIDAIIDRLSPRMLDPPSGSRSAGSSPAAIRERSDRGRWQLRGSARHPGSLAPPPTQPASASGPGQEAGEGVLVAPLQTWDLCSLSYTPTQRVRGREEGWVSATSPALFYFMLFCFFGLLTSAFKRRPHLIYSHLLRLCLRLNQRGKGELASKSWTTKPLMTDADENNV